MSTFNEKALKKAGELIGDGQHGYDDDDEWLEAAKELDASKFSMKMTIIAIAFAAGLRGQDARAHRDAAAHAGQTKLEDLADEGDGDPANGYNEFEDCVGAAPLKMRRKYRKKYDAVSLMAAAGILAAFLKPAKAVRKRSSEEEMAECDELKRAPVSTPTPSTHTGDAQLPPPSTLTQSKMRLTNRKKLKSEQAGKTAVQHARDERHVLVAERPIWREGDGGGKKRGKGVTVLVVD